MSFIYFGTGYFSRLVLDGLLHDNCLPSLIVTSPDRPKGRGLKFVPSLVAQLAQDKHLNVMKPESIKDAGFIDLIKKAMPDFILVADYGKILPPSILDIACRLSFAVHPSLLPKYRGATPLNRPFINGDEETGVTIFKMASTMDSGPIIAQARLPLAEDDTLISVTDRLGLMGAHLSSHVLLKGEFTLTPQDESCATYAPKFVKEDGLINWSKNPLQIVDFIRGTVGWPSAYTFYHDKKVQIVKIRLIEGNYCGEPGTIIGVSPEGVDVVAGCGIARIIDIKPEGKGVMSAYAFACGHHLSVGEAFGVGK